MAKQQRSPGDLQASELVAKFGLSRSYAFELIKGPKKPSLELAVDIERELGVPASSWVGREGQAA